MPRTTSPIATTTPAGSSPATPPACACPPGDLLLPPTPPPDFDLDAWRASIDTIEAWEPQTLAITHFGDYRDVAEHLDRLREALARLSELAATTDRDGYADTLRAEVAAALDETDAASFMQAMPPEDQWLGHRSLPHPRAREWRGGMSASILRRSMSQTIEKPRTGLPGSGLGGHWRVIVRNDDHNTFDGVAHALARYIPGITVDRGLPDRGHDPSQRTGDRLDRPSRGRRAVLGPAAGRGPDDGPARAGLTSRPRR